MERVAYWSARKTAAATANPTVNPWVTAKKVRGAAVKARKTPILPRFAPAMPMATAARRPMPMRAAGTWKRGWGRGVGGRTGRGQ
jgi:hypothetical protein